MQLLVSIIIIMLHWLTGKSLWEEYVSDGDHNEVDLVEDRGD